jgi:uncharacterized protein YkwD
MPKTHKSQRKKRSGLHHKQGKHYQSVYFPYLPAILFLILSILISGIRPSLGANGVLAYATEMSSSSLLSHTNQQRSANGAAELTLNSRLNQAAQAKANDMVSHDYWSHNTPDGQEPWIFLTQAGYDYQKAGENLAYGFLTSAQTVTGWMNSATHRSNMLDASFTEVGFGFMNAENFQSSGNQTVVVAMYGKPQVAAAVAPASPTPAPAATPQAATSPKTKPVTMTQTPQPTDPSPTQPLESPQQEQKPDEVSPVTTEPALELAAERQITRAQTITGGNLPWATFIAGIMGGTAVSAMFVNHGLRLRKLLRSGRKFALHHPAFDATMISIIVLAVALSERVGTIL